MTLRSVLPALTAAVVACLLFAAPPPAAASEDEAAITTRLYPGWNMMGWVASTTPVANLFADVPSLTRIAVWDAQAQQYRQATRTGTGQELSQITPGQGLWLEVESDSAIELVRTMADDYVLLSLQAGHNLVGWTGSDGTPIEEAVGRFGEALHYAFRWDAEARRFDIYLPDGGAFNTLVELNRGDALWVALAKEARWWQSGTGSTEFAFGEGVSPEREVEVRAALGRVIAFYAERYGFKPPQFALSTGEGSPTATVTAFARAPLATQTQVYANLSIANHSTGDDLEVDLAHEYFHVLQANLAGQPDKPSWMNEGAATYAGAVYEASILAGDSGALRQSWHYRSATFTGSLKDLEVSAASSGHYPRTYDLGAMAVDWLVGHSARRSGAAAGLPLEEAMPLEEQAERDSYLQYYRLLASSESWQEAFEDAFGISPADFYAEFEFYRDTLAGPVVVFFGDLPAATRAQYEAQATNTYTFFMENLGVRPFTHFSYIAADEESGRLARETRVNQGVLGGGAGLCSFARSGLLIFHEVTCEQQLTNRRYFSGYFALLQMRVDAGPRWLALGVDQYVTNRYAASAGRISYDSELGLRTFLAQRNPAALSQLLDPDSWLAAGNTESWALAFVAVDRLIEQADEGALAEYYRLLPRRDPNRLDDEPDAGSWQAAFEQAFGLTIDEFYEQFAEYRAGLSQP